MTFIIILVKIYLEIKSSTVVWGILSTGVSKKEVSDERFDIGDYTGL